MTDTISGANQKAGNVTPKKAIDSNRPQAGTPVGNNLSTGAVSGDSSVELSAKLKVHTQWCLIFSICRGND